MMIPGSCVKIQTAKFPILEGEEEEIVNENMYGKALCKYLEERLPIAGVKVPFYCCEDWGWWLEVIDDEFKMGLCIYSEPDATGDPESYVIMPSIRTTKKWSWSKFKKIDVSNDVLRVMGKLETLFLKDSEIDSVSTHDEFPY